MFVGIHRLFAERNSLRLSTNEKLFHYLIKWTLPYQQKCGFSLFKMPFSELSSACVFAAPRNATDTLLVYCFHSFFPKIHIVLFLNIIHIYIDMPAIVQISIHLRRKVNLLFCSLVLPVWISHLLKRKLTTVLISNNAMFLFLIVICYC